MSEWREVELKDVVDKLGDGLHGTPQYDDNGEYYFVNGNNLRNGHIVIDNNTKRVSVGEFNKYKKNLTDRTLLVSINGTLGNVAYYNKEKIILGKSACYFNVKNEVNVDYIRYVLESRYFKYYIDKFSSGTTIQNLGLKEMREFTFLLPNFNEQTQIAKTLSVLDDKITLLRQQNATLEALAQLLFKRWFVDGAKKEWELKELSEITDVGIGRTPPRKDPQWFSTLEDDVKWISIKDMGNDGVFLFETSEYLTRKAIEKFNIPVIPKNTVILSFKMTLGRIGITSEDMLSNEAIAHFKFTDETPITKEYLYLYLKNYRFENLGSTSSIVTSINSSMIKSMKIHVPDKKTMTQFQDVSENIFNKIRINQKEIQTLTQLRDTLLPKLMSGEVRISP